MKNNLPEKPNLPKDNPKYLNATPFFLQPRKYDPKPISAKVFEKEKSILEKRKTGLTDSEFRKELEDVSQDKVKMDRAHRRDVRKEIKHEGQGFKLKDVEKGIKEFHRQTSSFVTPTEKERLEAQHKETLLKIVKDKKL